MFLTIKGRRAAFFGANVVGFFALMFGHVSMSGTGLAFALGIMGLAGLTLIRFRPEEEPVSTDLAMLASVDLLAFCALMHDGLAAAYSSEAISVALDVLGESRYMGLALLGSALAVIGMWKWPTLMGIGGGVFGTALFLSLYTTGMWPHLKFEGNGMAVITSYVVASVFFSLCLHIAFNVSRDKKKRFLMLTLPSFISFGAWMYIAIGCNAVADELAGQVAQIALGFPTHEFAWWRVLLTSAALVALAYAFSMRNGGKLAFDIDATVLFSWAVLVLGVRVLMDCYFTFCWIAMALLIVATCVCVDNASNGKGTMRMNSQHWLGLLLVVFIVVVRLFSAGLWPSVAVGVPLAIVLFLEVRNYRKGVGDTRLALAIIATLVVEAMAWQGMRHNAVESMVMLVMVAAFASAAVVIINKRDPAGFGAPRVVVFGVCGCVALLCWLSLKPTARVSTKVDSEGIAVQISEVRAGDKLTGATYRWEDASGMVIVPETSLLTTSGEMSTEAVTANESDESAEPSAVTTGFTESVTKLPVVADHLVVNVSDVYGSTAHYDYYYAPWMHNFQQTRDALGIVIEEAATEASVEGGDAA